MDKLAKLGEKNSGFQFYFFVAVFFGILLLVYFVFKPFIFPFILAIIFAALFYPLYLKLLGFFNQNKNLSAFVSVFLILLLILLPLSFLGIKISTEAAQLYSSLSANGSGLLKGLKDFSQELVQKIFSLLDLGNGTDILIPDLNNYLRQGANWLLSNLKAVFSSLSLFIFKAVIFLAMVFYLFKYGENIKKSVIKFSPLPNVEDKRIFHRLNLAIHSIFRGSIIIALIQGLLTGLGFAIFGVPQPVLWGSVAVIAALIPSFGTALVLVPGIVFLSLSGSLWPAVGLLIWGTIAVGLIDNLLAPVLISRNSHIHPFLILLSVLGGIVFFGPAGFILGPLSLSFLLALFDIYFRTAEN